MKLIGAAFILLSGVCIGMKKSGELKTREERLLALKRMIQVFRTEICYTARPLDQLISENRESVFCSLAMKEPSIFQDPKDALQNAGKQLLKDTGDLELYRSLVKGLGESDSQSQMEHLDLYAELLETRLKQAEEAKEKKSRLYVCLGLFGGITLCLVLL